MFPNKVHSLIRVMVFFGGGNDEPGMGHGDSDSGVISDKSQREGATRCFCVKCAGNLGMLLTVQCRSLFFLGVWFANDLLSKLFLEGGNNDNGMRHGDSDTGVISDKSQRDAMRSFA